MNKVVVFNSVENYHIAYTWAKKLIDTGITLSYDTTNQKNLIYLFNNKDSKIYEGVLDYCEKENIELLIIPYLYFPEYLLVELNYRKNFKTKISFITNEKFITLSNAKTKVYLDLINKEQILKVLCVNTSFDFEKFVNLNNNEISKKLDKSKKIIRICEPFSEEAIIYNSKEAKKELGFKENDFIVLFFGSMFYGKGLDILLSAFDKIKSKNIKLLVASNINLKNFELDESVFNKKNIKSILRYVSTEEKDKIFSCSDLVALPYRISYLNNPSGILITAIQYEKLSLVPDFYPLNNLVKKYKIGLTSLDKNNIINEENYSNSLAEEIVYAKNNYRELYENANFKEVFKLIPTWEKYYKLMIGEKNES